MKLPLGRQERTRLLFSATAAAANLAASSGIDMMALGRNPAVSASMRTGIRLEALMRSARPDVACRKPAQIYSHVGGTGPGIVFLNGWTASGLMWPRQFIGDLENDHTVVRIDNRGSGWSRHAPRPYTMADLADDAHNVIESMGLERPIVVGLSMGGMIAQELAIRWPQSVGRLVLLGTRPPSPEATMPPPRITAAMFTSADKSSEVRSFMSVGWSAVTAPGFAAANRELIEEMAMMISRRPTPRFAVLDQARAIASWSGAHRLRKLDVPTTVVHGSDDPLIPVRNGMRIAQLIPGARYVELPNVGHLVPYESPKIVTDIIENRF